MSFSGSGGMSSGVEEQEALDFHQGRLTCAAAAADGDASWHPCERKKKRARDSADLYGRWGKWSAECKLRAYLESARYSHLLADNKASARDRDRVPDDESWMLLHQRLSRTFPLCLLFKGLLCTATGGAG